MRVWKVLCAAALCSVGAAATVSALTVAEISQPIAGDVESIGFVLGQSTDIDIDMVGIRRSNSRAWSAYAWILDSETREVVWETPRRGGDRIRGSKILRQLEDKQHLAAGRYELYYFAADWRNYWNTGDRDFFERLGRLFDGDDDYEISRRDLRRCYVSLTSSELAAGDLEQFNVDGGLPGALIRHNQMGDSEFLSTAFELSRPVDLRLYAVIENPESRRHPVDYVWIVNSDTREKVWEIDPRDLDHAGGGEKNEMFDGQISLDPGTYVLYSVTDDSHSYERFNVNPPYDPINWGVTVLPGDRFDRSAFRIVDVPQSGEPLIDFTRVRNDEFHEQSFALNKETKLHVYAIGEMSTWGDQEFVDFGAIQDAGTGNLVWEMTERNTEYAGGGEKNRMFDGTITLPAGTYTAFYITDDSHAYRRWNVSPPFDGRSYGMAIYPVGNTAPSGFRLLSEDELTEGTNILARITRVRDDERRRARFKLDRDSRVHIYALGEGTGGRMYDYAYIIDLDGDRDVWEMRMRRTRHAGGAEKNRVFDREIKLDAGQYEVVYVTDDSHSFGDWNAAPPRDPMNWGVTVSLVEPQAP